MPSVTELVNEHREMAQRVMQKQREIAKSTGFRGTTKSDLISIGKLLWEGSYKHSEDDREAYTALMALHGRTLMPELEVTLEESMSLPNQQILLMGSALWYHTGLHQVVLSHKFTAALLATKISKNVIPEVQPPWRAFYITLPNNMLAVSHPEGGREIAVTGILVTQMAHHDGSLRWCYSALTESTITLWRHGYTTQMLLQDDGFLEGDLTYDCSAFSEKLDDLDLRVTAMIGRLIVNVCLSMNDPSNIQRKPKDEFLGPKGHHGRKRQHDLPLTRTYILGKSNIIDCSEAVKTYLRTGKQGKEMTVQVLVSGHFRNQPHGTQRTLRKVIWIQPYWKGDENAPILVTPTVFR